MSSPAPQSEREGKLQGPPTHAQIKIQPALDSFLVLYLKMERLGLKINMNTWEKGSLL